MTRTRPVASPADLPRSARRALNRRANPRKPPKPGSLAYELAASGIATKNNTTPGTKGRQAVDAVTYQRRLARGRRLGATTARQALGQGGREAPPPMSAMFRGVGFAVIEDPTEAEVRRLGRWNAEASNLVQGDLSAATFRRRVRSWAPLRGERFEFDPDIVKATLRSRDEAGDPLFVYEGRHR